MELIKNWNIKIDGIETNIQLKETESLLDYIFLKFYGLTSYHEEPKKIIVNKDGVKHIIELNNFNFIRI